MNGAVIQNFRIMREKEDIMLILTLSISKNSLKNILYLFFQMKK